MDKYSRRNVSNGKYALPASTRAYRVDSPPRPADTWHILTAVSHRVRTLTTRQDLLGWVIAGRKTLISPYGDKHYGAGTAFLIPRNTHCDVINDAMPGGHYEAKLFIPSPDLVVRFCEQFGQFSGVVGLPGCASTPADSAFIQTFEHTVSALDNPTCAPSIQEHRSLEMLLLLAERNLVFSPSRHLSWSDRVCRLIGQRPNAKWTSAALAEAFHLSTSSLQRRLADEGSSPGHCIREVRLETAMALLQGSSLAISEIAARCGYSSHSRFSAAFRARFGYPPSYLRPEGNMTQNQQTLTQSG